MQISGRIFCNLADLCRLLFATCNDNQVISKSITLPTTTLTLLRFHVVCILQTRHPWGNGDGQLSLLFVPNVMFNKMMIAKSAFVLPCLLLRCRLQPTPQILWVPLRKTKSTNHYVYSIIRTLFKLPKLVMKIFLSQFDLNTIKHRRLGLALILVFEGYPNYTSNVQCKKTVPIIFVKLVADLINWPLKLPSSINPFSMLHADSKIIYLLMFGWQQI